MSSPAVRTDAATPRVVLRAEGRDHDVFEVLGITDGIAQVRTAYLFELGEELQVRVEHAGEVVETAARVRAHHGPAAARITELELLERTDLLPPGSEG